MNYRERERTTKEKKKKLKAQGEDKKRAEEFQKVERMGLSYRAVN